LLSDHTECVCGGELGQMAGQSWKAAGADKAESHKTLSQHSGPENKSMLSGRKSYVVVYFIQSIK